jgi:nicotinamide phosphoribosyltransferase
VRNTHSKFGWLTNYLETLISTSIWQPITSATIAREYKKLLNEAALKTTGTIEGNEWYAHDFSMRGMSSVESAITSGMGHLTSFTGSDCIPAIYQLKKSYGATGLIGASVPATEHSVACLSSATYGDMADSVEEVYDEASGSWKVTAYLKNGETVRKV